MEISKELLREVLGYKVYNYALKSENIKLNKITTSSLGSEPQTIGYEKDINIYELAHKCKEWALKRGYIIKSFSSADKGYGIIEILIGKDEVIDLKMADTETEAIFKACQWILDNKGQ